MLGEISWDTCEPQTIGWTPLGLAKEGKLTGNMGGTILCARVPDWVERREESSVSFLMADTR